MFPPHPSPLPPQSRGARGQNRRLACRLGGTVMLAFDPPAGFHDVSRYTFAGPGRRVTVRSSSEVGSETDLLNVAKDYESLQARMLGAKTTDAGVQKRADGVPYVVVTATSPEADRPYQESPAVDYSGFLLFANGVCVHLSLSAK